MEANVRFDSDGNSLSAILHLPDLGEGEKRPAVIVLHGFGGNKDAAAHTDEARLYESWGYIVLRFDMRGCGESEGHRGRVICLEQVSDTIAAKDFLATLPQVDARRIIVTGQSFGAAVAIYAGAVDATFAAVVSLGGWGDGLTKFMAQHSGPGEWERFQEMRHEGERRRMRDGSTLMVPRWDIVPVPERLRHNIPAGSIMDFPIDTVESMCAFRAVDVVGRLASRPLLLLHAAHDSVTPTEQSIALFRHAGAGADLLLLSDIDHFPFSDNSSRLTRFLKDWFDRHFPVKPQETMHV